MMNPLKLAAAVSNSSSLNDEEVMDFNSNPSELFGNLVWVIVCLAIVVTLIILVIKWLSQRNRSWGANRTLRSLGGVALSQNSSLQVIEIAGRIYVVGVGENVTLLDKLTDEAEVAAVMEALERQPEQGWSANNLSQLVKKWKQPERHTGPEPDKKPWNAQSSFETMLQSKLNEHSDRKQQLESMLKDSKTNERLMDNEK